VLKSQKLYPRLLKQLDNKKQPESGFGCSERNQTTYKSFSIALTTCFLWVKIFIETPYKRIIIDAFL